MRMEKFDRQFIKEFGVKMIIGKAGMGPETTADCQENKAVHGCVRSLQPPGGRILHAGAPFGLTGVRELGASIIPIDTKGDNLFEQNKAQFNERKGAIIDKINAQVRFIK